MLGTNKEIIGDNYDKTIAVKCNNGIFVGQIEETVKVWRGIPFAEPPVGNLRWKSPVYPKDDTRIFEAYNYAKVPIQINRPKEEMSEDCLYLNIFTGEDCCENKPVMVWIHGGSYIMESASEELYHGDFFAQAHPEVVLVTIEYRLNAIGCMNFSTTPGGEEYTSSGNLMLLDQKCALEWIQQNIAGFGGDPCNVTIFGESAGAGSVSLLPLIEGTDTLFNKIIVQSGTAGMAFDKQVGIDITENLKKIFNAKTVAELVQVPEDELKEKVSLFGNIGGPLKGDGILTEDPYMAYKNGRVKDKKMLIGSTADECRYMISDTGKTVDRFAPYMHNCYEKLLNYMTEEYRKMAEAYVNKVGLEEVWSEEKFFTQVGFGIPVLYQADLQSQYNDVFVYNFAFPINGSLLRAMHGAELPCLFNNQRILDNEGLRSDKSDYITKSIMDMWVNFAKNGNPSIKNIKWKKYSSIKSNVMIFDE